MLLLHCSSLLTEMLEPSRVVSGPRPLIARAGAHDAGDFPRVVAWTLVAGGLATLLGTYWDEAWHTDYGRDTFSSPPHLLLYAGVSVMLVAVAAWVAPRRRRGGTWQAGGPSTHLLALVGAAVTLLVAPVDDVWHRMFGRDAVMWSPPHSLGVAGLLTVGAGVLLAVRDRGRLLTAAAGALVLGPALVLVMEYEADVPQFALHWYLLVTTAGIAFAFALIRRVLTHPWAASDAAAAYTIGRLFSVGMLAALGHSLVVVPPVLVPALVDDLVGSRRARPLARALALTASAYLAYVPYHRVVPGGLLLTVADVAVTAPLALAAAWVAFRVLPAAERPARTSRSATVGSLGALLVLLLAGPAAAHDPGQGPPVVPIELRASTDGATATVSAEIAADRCERFVPLRSVARRGGQPEVGVLRRDAPCRFTAHVAVPQPGRWFVYVEFRVGGELTEAWVPVTPDRPGPAAKTTTLYRPPPASVSTRQVVAGSLLYGVNLAMLGAVVATYRRHTRPVDAPT